MKNNIIAYTYNNLVRYSILLNIKMIKNNIEYKEYIISYIICTNTNIYCGGNKIF